MKDTTIYEYGRTNNSGEITFTISPSATDTLLLTVTGINAIPYEKKITVIASGINEGEINSTRLTNLVTLAQSRPNPMIGNYTQISYTIAQPSQTSLCIYDAAGKLVKTLVNELKDRGTYNVLWNGKDENNYQIADGIYFYTLKTENYYQTKKLVLTR
jgi:flagellar hook assembly protein FlgD